MAIANGGRGTRTPSSVLHGITGFQDRPLANSAIPPAFIIRRGATLTRPLPQYWILCLVASVYRVRIIRNPFFSDLKGYSGECISHWFNGKRKIVAAGR